MLRFVEAIEAEIRRLLEEAKKQDAARSAQVNASEQALATAGK